MNLTPRVAPRVAPRLASRVAPEKSTRARGLAVRVVFVCMTSRYRLNKRAPALRRVTYATMGTYTMGTAQHT